MSRGGLTWARIGRNQAIQSQPANFCLPMCAGQDVNLSLKRKRWATAWRDARDEIGAGLGSARGFAVVRVDGGGVEGACWGWRAVRRHRFALDRSRPLKSLVLGSPLRVMPAAATSACVSLLIDVRGPVGRRAFRSRLVLRAASGGGE